MDPATPIPGLDEIEPQPPHGAPRGHWMDLGQGGLQTSMETQTHTGSCKAKKKWQLATELALAQEPSNGSIPEKTAPHHFAFSLPPLAGIPWHSHGGPVLACTLSHDEKFSPL